MGTIKIDIISNNYSSFKDFIKVLLEFCSSVYYLLI